MNDGILPLEKISVDNTIKDFVPHKPPKRARLLIILGVIIFLLLVGTAILAFTQGYIGAATTSGPEVSFSTEAIGARLVTDGEPLNLTIEISEPSTQRASVRYEVSGGNAPANAYEFKSGSVSFGPCDVKKLQEARDRYQQQIQQEYDMDNIGPALLAPSGCETSKMIQFTPKPTTLDYPEVQVEISLSKPRNLVLGKLPKMHVDLYSGGTETTFKGTPELSFWTYKDTISEDAKSYRMLYKLSFATDHPVSLCYSDDGGTAKFGVDYDWTRSCSSIPAGETMYAPITVKIIDNSVCEPDKTLLMKFHSIQGANITSETHMATTTLTIKDNDCTGT